MKQLRQLALVFLVSLSMMPALASTSFAAEESKTDYDLNGNSLGVELDMMPGGPENGSMLPFLLFNHDHFLFSLGGNFYKFKDDLNGLTRFFQGETRASYRIEIAPYSYLDAGLDFSWQWGTQQAAPMGSNFSTGPMIGLTRQFPHTSFFFTAFVVVAQYIKVDAAQAAPLASRGKGWGFFENGGVGIRYLF